MINKMLIDFGENILIFLNASSNSNTSLVSDLNHNFNHSVLGTLVNKTDNLTEQISVTPDGNQQHIKSLFSQFSLVDLKRFNFEIVFEFINSRANSYMPLLKGFLSIVYTFIFVILDGGFVVLGFVLNCVSFIICFDQQFIYFVLFCFSLYSLWRFFICCLPVAISNTNQLSSWTILFHL